MTRFPKFVARFFVLKYLRSSQKLVAYHDRESNFSEVLSSVCDRTSTPLQLFSVRTVLAGLEIFRVTVKKFLLLTKEKHSLFSWDDPWKLEFVGHYTGKRFFRLGSSCWTGGGQIELYAHFFSLFSSSKDV